MVVAAAADAGEDEEQMSTRESVSASDQLARGVDETRTRLVTEFQGRVKPDVIRRVVDDALEGLEEAPVRDFLPLFVYRAARDRLTDMARAGASR